MNRYRSPGRPSSRPRNPHGASVRHRTWSPPARRERLTRVRNSRAGSPSSSGPGSTTRGTIERPSAGAVMSRPGSTTHLRPHRRFSLFLWPIGPSVPGLHVLLCPGGRGIPGGEAKAMPPEVALAAVRRLLDQCVKPGKTATLAFLGGEPLLNRTVLQSRDRVRRATRP